MTLRQREGSITFFDATRRRIEALGKKQRNGDSTPTLAAPPSDERDEPPATSIQDDVQVANAAGPTLDPDSLRAFLVNFVVEQTGYPAEIVELDVDLEGELGIDSIKKAQLFGELGEVFQIAPAENLTLDDFPTLRHVMDYLLAHASHGEPGGDPPAPPPAAASTASAASEAAAPSPSSTEPLQSCAEPALDPDSLRAFLVNFVVEQTGYPEEIVELDVDLEGELGIDSIKKAQLFGELSEYFDVRPSDNLTLDDFPTLRQVMNFLLAGNAAPRVEA